MRARLCIAAGSSTSAAMSYSSRATVGRGRTCRSSGRGFCDRPAWWGRGGAFVSGDAHLWTVSEENHGRRVGCRGDAWRAGAVPAPPSPKPGFHFPHPRPGFHYPPSPSGSYPQQPPFHRASSPRGPWRAVPPPGVCPQPPPPFYGPPPENPGQAPNPLPPFYGPSPQNPGQALHPPPSFYGPSPRNPGQEPRWDLRPQMPRPRPPPADYRSWVPSSLPPPPPDCERFRVLSYNILADYLARDHQSKLYCHIPPELLDWQWRKRRLLIEFGLWSPDIMCLQEVDKFQELEEELAQNGYNGVWKMRTGNAVDGCAIFWRTQRFVLRHEEHIEFAKLGLRDNVAQICVLESIQSHADNGSEGLSARTDRVVVCNIHVLYNPKRGEIKLGQVRVLLDRAYSVSKIWNDAPVIICGDFNCTPKSPLYNFISEQELSLSGLARNRVSGQYSACIYPPRPSTGSGLYRALSPHDNNDWKTAPIKVDSHQTGIGDHGKTRNNVENALVIDRISSLRVSEKLCSYSQLENEKRPNFDATVGGVKVARFDNSTKCKEKDLSKGMVKDITEPGEVTAYMGSEGVQNFTSTNASPRKDLHTVEELQHDGTYVKGSFTIEILSKQDELVNSQPSPGNKGASHDAFDLLNVVKNISAIHTSCTYSNMQETFIDLEKRKDMINVYNNLPPFEGGKDGFSPARLESETLPDDAILDISTYERVSENFAINVGTSLPESIELHSGSVSGKKKADIDVSCQSSYKNMTLDSSNDFDSHLNLEAVDSSVNEVTKEFKNVSAGSAQVVADAHEKLPSVADDMISQNIICNGSSTQYLENVAFSRGVGTSASEVTSNLIDEEESNSNSAFLEELHGTGNASEFSSLSFPDPFVGLSVVEEEVRSDRLNSNTSHQPQELSKIQERIYDPFLWTPMEIEAASGNAECTILKHNLELSSAYTEVEDRTGTKDSSREPQVTSYNRQFMGTVDYIWHSAELQTLQVLDTIPTHVLRRTPGFPTKKWGSDHLALACEFAFRNA